jgi:hypothetical protein
MSGRPCQRRAPGISRYRCAAASTIGRAARCAAVSSFAYLENCPARIGGGARDFDAIHAIHPHGLAAETGSAAASAWRGLTLGAGYRSLLGRFGLALDHLLASEVVLADGRIVTGTPPSLC